MSYDVVLIVDGDANFRRTLKDILKARGYKGIEASSGKGALELLTATNPTVALIDIRMPDMSGIEIIKRARGNGIGSEFIILAGYSSHATAIEAVNLGVYQYLQKPFIMEQLLLTIHRAIEKRKAEEDLRLSMNKYRNLIDNAQEGIYQTAPEGEFLMVNRAMANMLGYDSPEELINSLGNITKAYVNEQDRMVLREMIDERGYVQNFEAQLYDKNGSVKWISFNSRAVRDEGGNLSYYEGLAEDITLRKKAEENLNNTLSKLRKAMEGAIKAMVQVAEAKDPYTAGHQRRVAKLARVIAQTMGLTESMIDGIRMAASIHDIGKIAVPVEILSKPSKLSDLEFSLIKTHSQAGYDILEGIEFPWPIARIIQQHHEKIDGSGYPQGLKGLDIMIEARIVCVADVVEAMASHRPYRPSLGIDKALEEVKENRGKLYDKDVADACIYLFKEKGFILE